MDNKEYQRLWYARNRDRILEAARKFRREHPGHNKERSRFNHLRKMYGMTEEMYNERLASQNGMCILCGSDKSLEIDHDHVTGRVRGIVCHCCNVALGQFKDNVEVIRRAIAYLEA